MFGKLFRRHGAEAVAASATPASNTATPAAGKAAPGTAIHYHPELIDRLKADHRVLLELFGQIRQAFGAGRPADAAVLLNRFRSALQDHLLVESVRLYVYLEHRLRADPASFRLIHDFRHEMDGIGKAATAFLSKYARLADEAALQTTFLAELDAVGQVLVERIQREESVLYPMYEPA